MTVDVRGFEAEMLAQKTRSKEAEAARRYGVFSYPVPFVIIVIFVPYTQDSIVSARRRCSFGC